MYLYFLVFKVFIESILNYILHVKILLSVLQFLKEKIIKQACILDVTKSFNKKEKIYALRRVRRKSIKNIFFKRYFK